MDLLILTACGLLFFIVGMVLLYKNTSFVKKAAKAEGEIVEINEYISSSSGRRVRMYSTIIEYTTLKNEAVHFTNPSSSSFKPKMGKKLGVLYHEEEPEKAKIASVFNLYIIPGILIVLGLFLFFLLVKTNS
jgi:hypothetical protein